MASNQTNSTLYLHRSMWLKGEDNYEDWCDNITMLLGSKGLAKYSNDKCAQVATRPDEGKSTASTSEEESASVLAPSQEDQEKWQTNSMTCAIAIKGSIEPDTAIILKGITNPKEMMKILRERFALKGWNLKHRYLVEYNTLRVEHFDSVGAFIDQFKVLKGKLDGLNLVLPEEAYTINFIALLDAQYPIWADRQRSAARSALIPLSLSNLFSDVLDESRKSEKATVLYANKPNMGGAQKGNKKNGSGGPGKSDKKCTHCKRKGHSEDRCWVKYPDLKPAWAIKMEKEYKAQNDSKTESGANTVLSLATLPALAAGSANTRKHLWCYDSGAVVHVTHTRANFELYTVNDGTLPLIDTVNGLSRPLGSGTVILEVESVIEGKTVRFELSNVLHLPSTPVNLFSGLQFELKGGYMKKGVMYNEKDQGVAQVETTPNGHFLKVVDQPMFNVSALHSGIVKPLPLNTWHRRLMHPSTENVKKTLELTKGGVIQKDDSVDHPCRACNMANSIRKVSRDPQTRRTRVFELVHVDVEKITPIGYNGHAWASLFTEDATRARWGWTFKEKKEAHQSIVHFNQMVATQWGLVVLMYRIDGGMEFGGKKLTAHLKNGGTLAQVTTPYTPEQNGVAERANRIIWGKTRAAVDDSDLPPEFWPEVYVAAIHITNRTATSTLDNMTPVEAFMRQVQPELQAEDAYRPDLSHLRAIGCRVYVNIPKERRVKSAKLDPHAEEGFLVGFEGSRIYRVYLPGRSQKVIRTSHCVFDESAFNSTEVGTDHLIEDEVNNLTQNENTQTQDAGLDQIFDPLPVLPIEEEEDEEVMQPPPAPKKRGRPKGAKNKPKEAGAAEAASIQLGATPHLLPPDRRITRSQLLVRQDQEDQGDQLDTSSGALRVSAYSVMLHAFRAATSDQEEPRTVQDAKDSPEWLNWLEAMKTELKALLKNGTWRAVSLKPDQRSGRRPLGTKWVFKIKRGKDGEILQYKARWVVKGYEQRYGLDYDQTFAGVTKASTWRIMFAIAAIHGWDIEQMDVKSAFLHGNIDEEVYVELPECWELFLELFGPIDKDTILLLLKALYGLKQSPRLWQLTLKRELLKLSFTPLFADQSVYRNTKTGCFIITYVDDFILMGPQGEAIKRLKLELASVFDMKDLGTCTYFLGIRITRSEDGSRITLCQDAYIRKVLDQFNMAESRPVQTPLEPGSMDSLVPFEGKASIEEVALYQSLIGCINYLATQTRPDISFSASILSRFLVNPSPAHIKAGKRVLQYLKGSVDFSITFSDTLNKTLDIQLFSDADYAGDRYTYRSTGAYVSFFAGGPATWQSKRQSVVAQSSTESEYMALSEAAKEAAWIRSLLTGLQYQGPDLNPITLYGDNQGSLALAENPTFHRGSKHIAVRYHFIRQEVEEGRLVLGYIPTNQMPADGLTKALKAPLHSQFIRLLGMKGDDERN
jgi:hypothetical protein